MNDLHSYLYRKNSIVRLDPNSISIRRIYSAPESIFVTLLDDDQCYSYFQKQSNITYDAGLDPLALLRENFSMPPLETAELFSLWIIVFEYLH